MDTTREIREMPTILVREAGLEEFNEKTRKSLQEFSEELPRETGLSDEDLQQLDPRLRPQPWDTPPPPEMPEKGKNPPPQTDGSTKD